MPTQPSRFRRLKRSAFRLGLGLVPFRAKVFVARRLFPNLGRYLPVGREVQIDDYLGEFRVIVDPRYPVEIAMLTSRYETDAVTVIDAVVREGHRCLDIGANVGALTLPMARRVGAAGRVYAFEPGPLAHARLLRNLSLNSTIRDRVVALQVGVSNEPGRLHWSPDEHGNPANATLLGVAGTPVDVVSIDRYFAADPLPRLDFVKIDVEGMEYEVLLGGRATWLAHRPIFWLETASCFDAVRGFPASERVEALLRGMGYALYRVETSGRLAAVTASTMATYTLAVPAANETLVNGALLPLGTVRAERVK
jgi:FkbM family methyltransferase